MRTQKQDKKVWLKFDLYGHDLWLYSVRETELDAACIEAALSEKLRKCIEDLSKKEYARGFSDAKAKRKRSDWFQCWLDGI